MTKESSNNTTEKQAFCVHCGRNFNLENFGEDDKPIWYMPRHIIKKLFGNSTFVCKGSNKMVE